MVTIKEAVGNTVRFALEILGPDRAAGLRLEEVESSTVGGEDAWLITLSMVVPPGPLDFNAFAEPRRDYKSFTVLKKSGEVVSMKIRELTASCCSMLARSSRNINQRVFWLTRVYWSCSSLAW
jgi:hypothetical protein